MTERTGWLRVRPTRVAFLVEDGEHADLSLDGIFADCYGRWGGRFSLIVPCENGRIRRSFWPWLELYDPDVIYSYVKLSSEDILEVHERIYPAEYIPRQTFGTPRLDVFGFKPDYRFKALSSLSVIFTAARSVRADRGEALEILEHWNSTSCSRTFADNFGSYSRSTGTSVFPTDAYGVAKLLTVVAPEIVANPQHGVGGTVKTVADERQALMEFAAKRATSLSLLSAWYAPRVEVQSHKWSGSFNLVVGDTFADRILFWNARSLIPSWLDRDLCCLRVSPEQLKDPAFVTDLVKLLQNRNHVNSGSGGQSHVCVRSISLTAEELTTATEIIRKARPWGVVTSELIPSLDACVPDEKDLSRARQDSAIDIDLPHKPGWTSFHWDGELARPPAVGPTHVQDAPPRHHFTSGLWSSDFVLENDGPGPRFTDVNTWRLPKRWRMAGAFEAKRTRDPPYAIPPRPRAARGGQLTVSAAAEHPVGKIRVPTASEAFYYALAVEGQWAHADEANVYPVNKVLWCTRSNEAAYLEGVVGLAGGLSAACASLLHPFLLHVFGRLGATPDVGMHDTRPIVSRLEKRAIKYPVLDLKQDDDLQFVADEIVRQARRQQAPMQYISHSELVDEWNTYRRTYWDKEGRPAQEDADVDWDADEKDSLTRCLQGLRTRQMLFQGYEWNCRRCHHHNWIDMSALNSQLACEVCHQSELAPVSIDWLFRPNEFLVQSLRDHSVLSLLWVLDTFRQRHTRSLYFAPPTKFAFDGWPTPAEADLLVVSNSRTYLCEVKNSWRVATPKEIDKLVRIAERLRPDVALLAVMDDGQKRADAVAKAKQRLASQGIEFQLLTASEATHDPYLPSMG